MIQNETMYSQDILENINKKIKVGINLKLLSKVSSSAMKRRMGTEFVVVVNFNYRVASLKFGYLPVKLKF